MCLGMFVSPSMLGTRPGGAIAAAWAALVGIGEAGYMAKAKALMATSLAFQSGIRSIPELRVLGSPTMSIVSWTARDEFKARLNVFAVADVLDKQHGFKVECQQNPTCLHVTLTPPHAAIVDEFVQGQTHTDEHTKKYGHAGQANALVGCDGDRRCAF